MKKNMLWWFWKVLVVALVIIVIPVMFYVFVRVNNKQEKIVGEHYNWEQNDEIMKMSARFKSIEPGSEFSVSQTSRKREGRLLFPIIKIGMSTEEIHTLLGQPSRIEPLENGHVLWIYTIIYENEIIIETSNGIVVKRQMV